VELLREDDVRMLCGRLAENPWHVKTISVTQEHLQARSWGYEMNKADNQLVPSSRTRGDKAGVSRVMIEWVECQPPVT